MNNLDSILNILKVQSNTLTEVERNALLLYVVDAKTLESYDMSYHDSVKIDRLIDTIAYIMEEKVRLQGVHDFNYERDIRAMGWVEDFAQECIDIFYINGGSGSGHRMISQWAKDLMSSLMSEYRYERFVSKRDDHDVSCFCDRHMF